MGMPPSLGKEQRPGVEGAVGVDRRSIDVLGLLVVLAESLGIRSKGVMAAWLWLSVAASGRTEGMTDLRLRLQTNRVTWV